MKSVDHRIDFASNKILSVQIFAAQVIKLRIASYGAAYEKKLRNFGYR